jgi:hypothetical protein
VIEWWHRSVEWLFEPARMAALTALLSSTANVVFAIALLVALFYFGPSVRRLLPRLRRAKLLGQEIELAAEIDQVQQAVTAAAQFSIGSVSIAVPAGSVTIDGQPPLAESIKVEDEISAVLEGAKVDAEIDEVLRVAAQSPSAGLMLLGTPLGRQLRVLASHASDISLGAGAHFQDVPDMALLLKKQKILPAVVADSVTRFWKLRNRVVHAGNATREEILRAIDIGIDLLRLLSSIPGATLPRVPASRRVRPSHSRFSRRRSWFVSVVAGGSAGVADGGLSRLPRRGPHLRRCDATKPRPLPNRAETTPPGHVVGSSMTSRPGQSIGSSRSERDRHRTLSNHPLSEIAPHDRPRKDYEKHGRPQQGEDCTP